MLLQVLLICCSLLVGGPEMPLLLLPWPPRALMEGARGALPPKADDRCTGFELLSGAAAAVRETTFGCWYILYLIFWLLNRNDVEVQLRDNLTSCWPVVLTHPHTTAACGLLYCC
jgi:hypothetical protein